MTPCAGCRVRHLKCDKACPCEECQKNGRECLRLNVRFRHLVCPQEAIGRDDCSKYEFLFDPNQVWPTITGKVEFVAETHPSAEVCLTEEVDENVSRYYGLGIDASSASAKQTSTMRTSGPVSSVPEAEGHDSYLDEDPPGYLAAVKEISHSPSNDTFGDIASKPAQASGEASQPQEIEKRTSYLGKVLPSPDSAWPLRSLEEGKLFQHFVSSLAPWFDVGDNNRHFGKIAAYMATSNPLLMTAILAIAALHLNRVGGQKDPYHAMTLHARCLQMIVSMLNDPDRVNDDCVLMTTTILHLYDGLESGDDLPRHLKGTSVFFPTEAVRNSSPLRKAVFWLHLRQEIYNACLYQRSVITDLSRCELDLRNEGGLVNDDTSFHQTLYITAQVSKWIYSKEPSHARWYELYEMMSMWDKSRPTSFDPIHFRAEDPRNGRYFPEWCYVSDEHCAAAHFLYLGKLLLTTHDPNLPRIGPHMKSSAAAMQETALSYVRTLVGIAVCNNFVPARFTATLAITLCASWFTDRGEQEALLSFISDTTRRSGWERKNVQRALIDEWGWVQPFDMAIQSVG